VYNQSASGAEGERKLVKRVRGIKGGFAKSGNTPPMLKQSARATLVSPSTGGRSVQTRLVCDIVCGLTPDTFAIIGEELGGVSCIKEKGLLLGSGVQPIVRLGYCMPAPLFSKEEEKWQNEFIDDIIFFPTFVFHSIQHSKSGLVFRPHPHDQTYERLIRPVQKLLRKRGFVSTAFFELRCVKWRKGKAYGLNKDDHRQLQVAMLKMNSKLRLAPVFFDMLDVRFKVQKFYV
jgi:hypothetical protein